MKKTLATLIGCLLLALSACGQPSASVPESAGGSKSEVRLEGSLAPITLALGKDGYAETELALKGYEGGNEVAVSYKSSDESIVTIRDGKAQAKGKGKATLTAKAGDQEEKIDIEVLTPIENDDFSVISEDCMNIYGRTYAENGALRITNTASGFEVNFIGSSLEADLNIFQGSDKGSLKVYIDGEFSDYITFPNQTNKFVLAEELDEGIHTVKVLKMTEQGYFKVQLEALKTDGEFLSPKAKRDLKFEFYGDSITSGYGNLGNASTYQVSEDGTLTYASMLAEKFDAEYSVVSYAGVPACLKTANSLFTMLDIFDKTDASCGLDYDFSSYAADAVFVNLGTNDSNGLNKNSDNMCEGYAELLRKIRSRRPDSLIMCVYGMMGIDPVIEAGIVNAVSLLTERENYENIVYFALESDTSGRDGHPLTEVGHRQAAEAISAYMKDRNLI